MPSLKLVGKVPTAPIAQAVPGLPHSVSTVTLREELNRPSSACVRTENRYGVPRCSRDAKYEFRLMVLELLLKDTLNLLYPSGASHTKFIHVVPTEYLRLVGGGTAGFGVAVGLGVGVAVGIGVGVGRFRMRMFMLSSSVLPITRRTVAVPAVQPYRRCDLVPCIASEASSCCCCTESPPHLGESWLV